MPLTAILEFISVSILCVIFGSFIVIGLAKLASGILGDIFIEAPDWVCALVATLVGFSAAILALKGTLMLIKWICFT